MDNKFTSLKLSKKLKEGGCDLESEMIIKEAHCKDGHVASSLPRSIFLEKDKFDTYYDNLKEIKIYKSYDLIWDICIKYAKEFWGIDKKGNQEFVINGLGIPIPAYEFYPLQILILLQQNKKQEVEDYIWSSCLFNPKNKKEK